MSTHRINLKGPWEFTWVSDCSSDLQHAAPSGTVKMPQPWSVLFGDDAGTATFRRKFHRPTNLDPHERVMLLLTQARGSGKVSLNEVLIGSFIENSAQIEFDISEQLQSFNQLSVEISFDPQQSPGAPGGLVGVVALEIRG